MKGKEDLLSKIQQQFEKDIATMLARYGIYYNEELLAMKDESNTLYESRDMRKAFTLYMSGVSLGLN